MRLRLVCALALAAAAACGGGMTKEAADQQVDQLITLYQENRPKFVVQKQEIVQADDCDRAEKLRASIDEKAKAAAMSPENTQVVTAVQMELQQAEKDCKAK